MQKELLKAMLQPNGTLKGLQDAGEFTAQLVLQEELKGYPWADVWAEFCRREGKSAGEEWLGDIKKYERDVLSARA